MGHVMGAGQRGPVLVINGATGVRQWYYARFAAWAAAQGATVLTWDYRGIGESRPHRLRGFPGTMRDWGHHDLEGVLRFAHAEWSGRPQHVQNHRQAGDPVHVVREDARNVNLLYAGTESNLWVSVDRGASCAFSRPIVSLPRLRFSSTRSSAVSA